MLISFWFAWCDWLNCVNSCHLAIAFLCLKSTWRGAHEKVQKKKKNKNFMNETIGALKNVNAEVSHIRSHQFTLVELHTLKQHSTTLYWCSDCSLIKASVFLSKLIKILIIHIYFVFLVNLCIKYLILKFWIKKLLNGHFIHLSYQTHFYYFKH